MTLRSRQIIAGLVVGVYVMTGLLLDVVHHHAHDIGLFSVPVVSSHDCGAREIHLPIDKRNECVVCSHTAQRQSAGATEYLNLNTAFTCLAILPVLHAQPLETDLHCSGTRGPPAA